MPRAVRLSLRIAVLALLLAAIADLPVPGRGAPRVRIYAVDASGSVRDAGARDAMRIFEADRRRFSPGDETRFLAFGARPVPFDGHLPAVARDATDLGAALEAAVALAGDTGDVVVATDGRDTAGSLDRALLIAQQRGVPLHVLPVGALDGVDVRIAAVDLPPSAPPDSRFEARVTLESTGPVRGDLNGVSFEFASAGRQTIVLPGLAAKPVITFRLGGRDACPENDAVDAAVLVRDDRPRVRAPAHLAPLFPSASVQGDPAEFDAVIVDTLDEAAARACIEQGVGLIALGGSRAYALGGWAGTALERALPLWAYPDERTSAAFVLDRSGSMADAVQGTARSRIDFAVAAVEEAVARLHADDTWALITFADAPRVDVPARRGAARISRIGTGGGTAVRPALDLALDQVQAGPPGRRLIVLITDGETEEKDLAQVARRIEAGGAKLLVVATSPSQKLQALGVEPVMAHDLPRLSEVLLNAIAQSRALWLDQPVVTPTDHPLMRGLPPWPPPARVNRTSAKAGVEILAKSGDAPVLALGHAGLGRAAAATFALEAGWTGDLRQWPGLATLLSRLVDEVAPPARGISTASATLERDTIVFHVRAARGEDGIIAHPARLVRVTEDLYEARLPAKAGTTVLRVAGRAIAAFTLPHPPEYAAHGPDGASLRRITELTGGRLLEAAQALEQLPPRAASGSRPGRSLYLALALLLFLVDLAMAVFWR